MLTDPPDVDAPTRAVQFLPEDVLVRRIGLEHEFFLVDQRGELSDLADPFLWRCQEAARAKGLDPHCFKPECVTNLVEVTTPRSSGFADMQGVTQQPRSGARGRIGARPLLVSPWDLPPPSMARSPRRSGLQDPGTHHRA